MSSKACSDLCSETSIVTPMAQKNPKRPRDSFFQVRATNKMNENIWHPNLHKLLQKC